MTSFQSNLFYLTHPCNIDLLNGEIPSKLEQLSRVFHTYNCVEFAVIFNETYINICFIKIVHGVIRCLLKK